MPDWAAEVRRRLVALRIGAADEAEIVEELAQHLEDRYAELRSRGESEPEARRLTLEELAESGALARRLRATRRPTGEPVPLGAARAGGLAALWSDLRYGLRLLRRNPAFTLAAVLTLALGIGANTAIFSAVDAVILRPLPFPDPGRLFMLWEENPEKGWHQQTAAPANYLDWKAGAPAFADMAAYSMDNGPPTGGVALNDGGPPTVLSRAVVTGNFFSVLGAHAALGRTLRPEETWQGAEHVVVLSHRLWTERYGGARSILGRSIRLNGESYRVVGVMPSGFGFPDESVDVWYPPHWDPASRTQTWFRRAHWIRVIGRLRPGATPGEADAQLQAVVSRLKREYPETNRYMGAGMTPLHRFLVGDTRTPLLVLLAAVGLLLLIACANVGNLLLVRAAGRQREMAVRSALGAGRLRLVRQLMTESLALSLLGGAAGLGLGWAATRVLAGLQPAGALRVASFGIDLRVVGYIVAVTAGSGLLFGLLPSLWSGRAAQAAVLREGGRQGAPGRSARRAAEALVVAEVALALLLVTGAGLLVRSFWRLEHVDPGFDARGVLTVTLDLPDHRYGNREKVHTFYTSLLERLRQLPGVESAAATSDLPLEGTGYTSDFAVAGRGPDDYGTEVLHREVTPGYFHTMRVPLLRGRAFTAADRLGSVPVVLINEALARKFFRGEDPVGQRVAFDKHPDSTSVWRTIVGVVGDERQSGMALVPHIEMIEPNTGVDWSSHMSIVLRTTAHPASLGPAVRAAVHDLDPELPLMGLRPMDAIQRDSLARQRFLMALLLGFAIVALALAVIGVYGVTANMARQRTQEIGVRLALGARAGDVVRLVIRQGLSLVAAGVLVGVLTALAATRLMAGMLFDVPPNDAPTYLAVAVLLAATGLAASWLPARRASRADPAVALRSE